MKIFIYLVIFGRRGVIVLRLFVLSLCLEVMCLCSVLVEDFVWIVIYYFLDFEISVFLSRFIVREKGLVLLMIEFEFYEVSVYVLW